MSGEDDAELRMDGLEADGRTESLIEELTIAIERQGGGAAAEVLDLLFADLGWARERIALARNTRAGREARAAFAVGQHVSN